MTLPNGRLPLVGRARELAALTTALDAARKGRGSVHFVAGEGGVGKTRLVEAVRDKAVERGLTVVTGRAFPVETGIPYAIFGDGFVPLLREMPPATLQAMSRGAGTELALLFPALRADGAPARGGDAAELKPRLFDAFNQLLAQLTRRAPLLVVLENLHWADPSSLDLLHFIARGVAGHAVVLVATYNDAQRNVNRMLRDTEQSLLSLGVLTRHLLPLLTREECRQLIVATFGEEAEVVAEFADRVHARTRGSPLFIEETLKALVDGGRLRREGDRWVGWATQQLSLPDSIRDILSARYDRLSEPAQAVVQLAAVMGAETPYALLERLTGLDAGTLLQAVDELRRDRVFEEVDGADGPAYVFTHPLLQEMLYYELGRARVRVMHAQIADALEAMHGAAALEHAEELAIHFRRAEQAEQAARAIKYLVAAGHRAVARGAHREAAESLTAALALVERADDREQLESVLESLGRARHRLGDYAGARALFTRAVALAEARGDDRRVAELERRLGLAALRMGEFLVALGHHDRGLAAALRAGDRASEASFHLARSAGMMEVGDGAAAERAGAMALGIAEALGDDRLLGRVHQALQALRVWRGPSREAVLHGTRALECATRAQDLRTAWQAEWVFGFHAGLTGDSEGTARHIAEAMRLADELRSPVLRLWTREVMIEYQSGIGAWDKALLHADMALDEARAFGQQNLLPRLLVWAGLVHCGRGDLERAKALIDEAWRRSGAERAEDGTPINVHHVVPAHVGMGYHHLYRKEYRLALEVGERGLAIADRTGYTVWAVHRLLPLVAEASLWLREWDLAAQYGERLRQAAEQLGHPLARAWADACFALSRMLQGDQAGALTQLREAADALDAIPFVEHAARLRRKLVDALLVAGHRDEAVAELRRVFHVFDDLRAESALEEVVEKFRELGEKPPKRKRRTEGLAQLSLLTPRELEISRLVAERKQNKEIGAVLKISSRTVGTHISNILKKLDLDSRGALADFVRENAL